MKSLVFDTETTGLIKNSLQNLKRQPHIIEFFGLTIDNQVLKGQAELPSFHLLFRQERKLTEEIVRITGITDAILEGASTFAEKAEELKTFIESHDEVIAHNATFDTSMIDIEMSRCNLKVKWPKLICTVEATEWFKGHRLKLIDLHEFLFGERFEGAHRAENDVRALARCVEQLKTMGHI